MMTEYHRNPELADAYLDGLAAGMDLADAYRENDDTDSWRGFRLTRTTMLLVRVLLIVSTIGWTLGLLQMTGIVR